MAKRFSERLSELSRRVREIEDAVAEAQKEKHDELIERRQQAHAAATRAVEEIHREIKSVEDTTSRAWNTLQAKIAADLEELKDKVAERKRERDIRRAESEAERLEWEAALSIDYAISAIERARFAVIDAVMSRVDAKELKNTG
jgi:hypothetical protein